MRKTVPLILMTLVAISVFPRIACAIDEAESASVYNQAGTLYREGKFSESLELFEQLIGKEIANPDLLYNAANAAYRLDLLGKAVLYLERALRLAPSDEDALSNLAFINSIKQDKDPVNDNPVVAFITRRYNAVNINSAALWSGLSFALAMLCATGILIMTDWKRLTAAGITAMCSVIFILSTGMLIEKVHHRNTVTEAVIMVENAQAYSGPGADNTHIFTVHEGTKVEIQRRQDAWNLIRLKSGAGAWVKADSMERI